MSLRLTEEEYRDLQNKRKAKSASPDVRAPQYRKQPESKLERRLDQQIEEAGLEVPRRNWFLITGRDYELDRAWPTKKIAVEVQGMAHRIKGKFQRDIEKRALALLAGWRVLEVDGASVRDGRAIQWLKELLK